LRHDVYAYSVGKLTIRISSSLVEKKMSATKVNIHIPGCFPVEAGRNVLQPKIIKSVKNNQSKTFRGGGVGRGGAGWGRAGGGGVKSFIGSDVLLTPACYLWKDVEISNIEEGRALFVADRAKVLMLVVILFYIL
jgi:hypothetical protein